jgi:hypothetical protein
MDWSFAALPVLFEVGWALLEAALVVTASGIMFVSVMVAIAGVVIVVVVMVEEVVIERPFCFLKTESDESGSGAVASSVVAVVVLVLSKC